MVLKAPFIFSMSAICVFPQSTPSVVLSLVYTFGVSFLFSQRRQKEGEETDQRDDTKNKKIEVMVSHRVAKGTRGLCTASSFFSSLRLHFLQACVLKAFGFHPNQLFNPRHMNICNSTWRQPEMLQNFNRHLSPEDETFDSSRMTLK